MLTFKLCMAGGKLMTKKQQTTQQLYLIYPHFKMKHCMKVLEQSKIDWLQLAHFGFTTSLIQAFWPQL